MNNMIAAFEIKKFAARVGETIEQTNQKFRDWFDTLVKKSAEKEVERVKTLGIIAFGALPLAIGRILVGGAKIAGKGVDRYLLDEHWRKGMKAGKNFIEGLAKG